MEKNNLINNEILNRNLYLNLLKKTVIDCIYEPLTHGLIEGIVVPKRGHTMIGLKRLNNIQNCFENILKENVEGDLIETGVWKGGATIFMAGLVKAYNENRKIFVADSFDGLPKPSPEKYPVDNGDMHWTYDDLSVSFEEVYNNFKNYDLLDENVVFLKGWFKDTLPTVNDKKFSLIRLDGDMYESTWDALKNLYNNLSIGGYVIIDDWLLKGANQAVIDFRNKYNIVEEINYINDYSVYWKKLN